MSKSIKRNAVLNIIKTISSVVFPLITFPYISRVLAVDSVGAYNFSASVVSYCMLFAGLGVSNYAIREGSQYRDDRTKMTEFISDVFSLNMISTIIVYACLFVLLIFVPKFKAYSTAILIMSTEIFFATIGVNWVCNIYEDFRYIAIRTIVFQLFSLVSIFLFVHNDQDYYRYVIISVIAASGGNLLNYYYIKKKYVDFRMVFSNRIKRHIKPIMVIFASVITITLYVNSDIIILGFLTNDHDVGLYSIAVKIYTIIKNVLVAILSVLVPRFSILFATGNKDEANVLFDKALRTITVLLFPVVVGLLMAGDDVIFLLASGKYAQGGSSLRVLSISILFSLFAYLCTHCVLLPVKKENVVLYASIVSAVTNIVFNFLLIPLLGFVAAALTTVFAEAIMCICCMIVSKNYVTINLFNRDIIKAVIACFGIVVVCFCFKNIENHYLRLFADVSISSVLYFLLLVFMKHNIIYEYVIN